jgi:hypothetical protein
MAGVLAFNGQSKRGRRGSINDGIRNGNVEQTQRRAETKNLLKRNVLSLGKRTTRTKEDLKIEAVFSQKCVRIKSTQGRCDFLDLDVIDTRGSFEA